MERLSFFGRLVQKLIVSCFSDSFVQKTTQQSDGNCNVTNDSQFSYKLIKNSFITSANTYEKYIESKGYSFACNDGRMSFLPNCRYHIILIGNIEVLLQKLDALCFY